MPRKRSSPKTDSDIAGALQQSLNSTYMGLEALLTSLSRSGFEKAITPYRQMQAVLVQQRMWCLNKSRKEIDPLWTNISETAAKLYSIFDSFRTIMEGLQRLDSIEIHRHDAPQADKRNTHQRPSKGNEEELQRLLTLLVEYRSLSMRRIRELCEWSEAVSKERIGILLDAGLVVKNGWGRSLGYRLSPSIREKLCAEILHIIRSPAN